MQKGKEFLSQLKLYTDYLKWNDELGRYETWEEACESVLDTHILKYGEKVRPLIDEVTQSYKDKNFLASQRNLQWRGPQVIKNNAKLYNCCVTYAYTPDVFAKGFFVLLSGTGLGVSLKSKFVNQLPELHARLKGAKNYVVEDSIEGWSDAAKILIASYCKHPSLPKEFFGYQIKFDFSKIRPKGAYISGGFGAPGPDGLKQSLERIEKMINDYLGANETAKFKSIIAYDIFMHLSDAVLSGGVRRSAMNILMDKDDEELVNAKTGNWRQTTPWRARSNNSVGLIRGEFAIEEFKTLIEKNQGDNDIGFVLMSHEDEIFNPCFSLSQRILTVDGWRSFGELLDTTPEILQDNRVVGKLVNGKEEWEFDLAKNGISVNKATKVQKTGEQKDIYLLETYCGRSVEATGDHDFATEKGMVKLIDLQPSDKILVGVDANIPNIDFQSYDYVLGFIYGLYYGDGTNDKNATLLEVWETNSSIRKLIEERVEFLITYNTELLKNVIRGNTQIKPTFSVAKKTDAYIKYRLQSSLLTQIFTNENLFGKDDLDALHYKSKNFKSGFVSGFVYTDGHIEASQKDISIRITQSNKKALQNTMLVLQELGIFAKVFNLNKAGLVRFRENEPEYKTKASYRLLISGVNNCKKAAKIFELFDEKKEILQSYLDTAKGFKKPNYVARVKSVTWIKKEDVYCLEENNNRTLIVEGLTARRCFEIGFNFYSKIKNKNFAVYQFCNLDEISASACVDKNGKFNADKFYEICRHAAIVGTLQAGYDNFPYLGDETNEIVKGEALLGVSVTGWMDCIGLFNEEVLRRGAAIVKKTNEEVAALIGINPAARTTTVKPSGNASVILMTPSGIHADHSQRYFRLSQLNKNTETARYLEEAMPEILEESRWSATNTDYIVYTPVENRPDALFKDAIMGVKHLEMIKLVKEAWVDAGASPERSYVATTSHNVSNTVLIDDMERITQYIFDHQYTFSAVSFLVPTGDKDYVQAPFTSVLNTSELIEKYGDGVIFMSGLIVDGLHYFNDDLWDAAAHVLKPELPLTGTREQVLLKKHWIKRVNQFAKNYFKKDIKETVYCMKDVHLWHKWNTVNRVFKTVDFTKILKKPEYTDVGTLGAIACQGGACEIVR